MGGHGIKVPRGALDVLTLAGSGDVIDLLPAQTGFLEYGDDRLTDQRKGVSLADAHVTAGQPLVLLPFHPK